MTVATALANLEADLQRAGVASPVAEARLMLSAVTGLGLAELLLAAQRPLSRQQQNSLMDWVSRRLQHEPLQYILGTVDFFGLELEVSPAVLIPRPETESLVELVLRYGHDAMTVLDIATGSGAIALVLKHHLPDSEVWASDISPQALELAQANASRLGLSIHILLGDLLTTVASQKIAAQADVITANLPYLADKDRRWLSQEVMHEPALALFSGADGLHHFRRLERQAFAVVSPQSQLWLELDPRNVHTAWHESSRWTRREIYADLVGRERFLRLIR